MNNDTTNIYVGIDVSKASLDIYISVSDTYLQVTNDKAGIAKLLSILDQLRTEVCKILVGMEATGGLQKQVASTLQKAQYKVFVINPEHVWAYRRSLGKRAKTDKIDSRLIAQYIEKIQPRETRYFHELEEELRELIARRTQCIEMIVNDKKRLYRCVATFTKNSLKKHIKHLEKEVAMITQYILQCVQSDSRLLHRYNILCSIPGIGKVIALTLIARVPELGELEHKEIAALIGVAPMVVESGIYKGRSRIHGGRNHVRAALFMGVVSAMKVNKPIKELVIRLETQGKPYKVIVVAVMKKLITYANAMIKNNEMWRDNMS